MTPRQQNSIERIKAQIIRQKSLGHPEEHEFKKFEITDSDTSLVFLITEYGNIGDENDLRSLMCRDCRQFAIGRKGGITLISNHAFGRNHGMLKVKGLFNSVNHY